MAVESGHVVLESGRAVEPSFRWGGTLGFLSGIVIGAAAGLIGVGGGEFRIPVLLHVLRLPVKEAAGANTVIGLFVVVLSFARRWGQQRWTTDDLTLGAVMAALSIFGAVIGARKAHKLPTRLLKQVVCVYLLAVGVWLVAEGLAEVEHHLFEPTGWFRWTLAALIGFLIAAASGALGVAGGEILNGGDRRDQNRRRRYHEKLRTGLSLVPNPEPCGLPVSRHGERGCDATYCRWLVGSGYWQSSQHRATVGTRHRVPRRPRPTARSG